MDGIPRVGPTSPLAPATLSKPRRSHQGPTKRSRCAVVPTSLVTLPIPRLTGWYIQTAKWTLPPPQHIPGLTLAAPPATFQTSRIMQQVRTKSLCFRSIRTTVPSSHSPMWIHLSLGTLCCHPRLKATHTPPDHIDAIESIDPWLLPMSRTF
jgi:hypothetical protein